MEEALEAFEDLPIAKFARGILDSVMNDRSLPTNDASLILQRAPMTFKEWVNKNAHIFL